MVMIYALVLAGAVKNTIVLKDDSMLAELRAKYTCVVRVDQMEQYPGPGWRTSDCAHFTAPPAPLAPSPRPSPSPSHS